MARLHRSVTPCLMRQGPGADQIYRRGPCHRHGADAPLCGPEWKPAAVLLPHRRPHDVRAVRGKSLAVCRHLQRRAGGTALSRRESPSGGLPAPIRDKYALLAERLKTVARQQDLDFAEQVRRVVRGLVAVRRCSLDEVAALFSMNRRRMNRMLEREGTTYHQISQRGAVRPGRTPDARYRHDAGQDFGSARLLRRQRIHPRVSRLAWR